MASVEISESSEETLEDREARELLLLRAVQALAAVFKPPALIGRLGRSRFGLMTAGLTKTTLEALLNRAVIAIEHLDPSDARPSARVRFSVAPMDPSVSLEEALGQNGNEFAARIHRRAKTAMLAD